MQSIGSAHSMNDDSYNTAMTNGNNNNNNNDNNNVSTPEPQKNPDGLDVLSAHDTPFFADMTLDLSVAHDIAETPEATTRKTYNPVPVQNVPAMPSLPEFQQASKPAERIPYQQSQRAPIYNDDDDNDNGFPEQTTTTTTPFGLEDTFDLGNGHDMIDSDESSGDENENQIMARVTSNNTFGGRFRPFGNSNGNWRARLRRKQWPKDIAWAVAFWMIVPASLLVPIVKFRGSNNNNNTDCTEDCDTEKWLAAATSPRSATLHTLTWGLLIAAGLLPRLLYRTTGGVGSGDDERHFASQWLLASAPISALVYIGLVVGTYVLLPHAFWPYGLIPLWYLARDLYLFRRWKMTATTPGGRQAFFQAISCAALDILSRSLKRKPFYRTVVIVIFGQFGVIILWRLALLAALRSGSLAWAIIAFLGGKWATGTVARLLTLAACGGVSNWFAEQSSLLERMQQMEGRRDEVIEFTDLSPKQQQNGNGTTEDGMPEAYRMADASEYKPSVNTGMDGDFESDDDESFRDEDSDDEESNVNGFLSESALRATNDLSAQRRRRERHQRRERRDARSSTVRQLMASGLSTSFGSVTKCGLLGGLAQVVWSQIRKIDHARATLGGMRGMPVGTAPNDSPIAQKINAVARDFVTTHSDMAMSYVADYQMSYTRAAQEVALLLEEAGVEPILHDDISTHMSACVGGSVSGIIVLFTGSILVHQRNQKDAGVPDSAVALDMVIAFFFCYTLIFTVMEPLRASIKALYVCFAQHPEALSQGFPLIFHRLTRMSRSNLR